MKTTHIDVVATVFAAISLIAIIVKSIVSYNMTEFLSYYIAIIIVVLMVSIYFTIQCVIENKNDLIKFFSRIGRISIDLSIFLLSKTLKLLESI